jgi:predicted nucleotidyltransferase
MRTNDYSNRIVQQRMRPSIAFARHRADRVALIARFPVAAPRVFGSALHGTDREDSDLDLLVDPLKGATLFDLGELQIAAEDLLGVRVVIKTPSELPPGISKRILTQAEPL